jgi:hypothetical protein
VRIALFFRGFGAPRGASFERGHVTKAYRIGRFRYSELTFKKDRKLNSIYHGKKDNG